MDWPAVLNRSKDDDDNNVKDDNFQGEASMVYFTRVRTATTNLVFAGDILSLFRKNLVFCIKQASLINVYLLTFIVLKKQ